MLAAGLLALVGAAAATPTWGGILTNAAGAEPTCGAFSQSREVPGITRPLASGGSFIVSAEHGLAWMQTRPFESLLVIDDERITQKVMDHPPVTTTEQEQPEVLVFSRVLLDVFRGEVDALAEKFVVRLDVSGDDWRATLEPKDELLGRVFRHIVVSGSAQLEEVIVRGALGDTSRIVLSGVAPCDPEASDADISVFDIR